MVCLHLKGLPGPIEFCDGVEPIAGELASVLRGWPILRWSADAEPFLVVSRSGPDIRVERMQEYWTALEPTGVSAVCTLVVELVAAFVQNAAGLGSLHAAAAEFAGRLVVFPAAHRAGKSTLMARLAASSQRVFADDLLPVDLETGEAVATGCLPRLRLPLPGGSAAILVRHVDLRTVLTDGYYAYVEPEPRACVRHGDRARIGAFVVLQRSDRPATARLEPIPIEDALLALLVQNTNDTLGAEASLRGYLALLGDAPAFRLRFSDIEDATACLESAFASWPETRSPAAASRAFAPEHKPGEALPAAASGAGPLYRRNPAVTLNPVGDAGFLVDPARNGIHRLNAIGVGLWNLLATPCDEETIVYIFAGAFPDIARSSIRQDVSALLRDLSDEKLIEKS